MTKRCASWRLAVAVVAIGAALSLAALGGVAAGQPYTVNSSADTDDLTCDAADCTLREAINAANANAGADFIVFSIGTGPQTIAPLSPLPILTDVAIVEGSSQPGFAGTPIIELDGSSAGAAADGLVFSGGSSMVRNLAINRFGGSGILLDGTGGNVIQGNYLGVDVTGGVDVGNGLNGVRILAASDFNTIGGTTAADRNVISGNDDDGIFAASPDNIIHGNYIGADASGTVSLGNSGDGIEVTGGGNAIGGSAAGAGNVLGGNAHAIHLNGVAATANVITGNLIGVDVSGAAPLPNLMNGVHLQDAPGNTIGGTSVAERNIISANFFGVYIAGSGATGNMVQGNFIGTDVTGTVELGNFLDGVDIDNAPSNTIGGAAAGAGNLISGNDSYGVFIAGAAANFNAVSGNFIGTDVTGSAALGNFFYGVVLFDAPANSIGSNVIAGNNAAGILFFGISNSSFVVRNFIGTDATGTAALGNGLDGVQIDGSSVIWIGGTFAGDENVIAFNGGDGVGVLTGASNYIRHNVIHSNVELGIDLGADGVTPNDTGDPDAGANLRQNYPALTLASYESGMTTIQGTLNSAPSTAFALDFYTNVSCDPAAFGEGETFLGSLGVTTDALGDTSFTATFASVDVTGAFATVTAIDPAANTSEFSACLQVVTGCFPDILPPVVTAPAAITVVQTDCSGGVPGTTGTASPALAAFLAAGSATDNCDPTPTPLAPQVAGVDADNATFFPVGTTTVTFRFQDDAGNIGTATSTVSVDLFYGDLNEDGVVNAGDAVILSNFLVGNLTQGPPPFTAPFAAADLNRDTFVNAIDAVILANRLVGNIACLPNP